MKFWYRKDLLWERKSKQRNGHIPPQERQSGDWSACLHFVSLSQEWHVPYMEYSGMGMLFYGNHRVIILTPIAMLPICKVKWVIY